MKHLPIIAAVAALSSSMNVLAVDDNFSLLEGIQAEPMNAAEMDAVQGRATPITLPRTASTVYSYWGYSMPSYGYGFNAFGSGASLFGATPITLP